MALFVEIFRFRIELHGVLFQNDEDIFDAPLAQLLDSGNEADDEELDDESHLNSQLQAIWDDNFEECSEEVEAVAEPALSTLNTAYDWSEDYSGFTGVLEHFNEGGWYQNWGYKPISDILANLGPNPNGVHSGQHEPVRLGNYRISNLQRPKEESPLNRDSMLEWKRPSTNCTAWSRS